MLPTTYPVLVCAACMSTRSSNMADNADSYAAQIVARLNTHEAFADGCGLVTAPTAAQLLTFGDHFGPTVRARIIKSGCLPTICHISEAHADTAMEAAVAAAINGAYVLPAEGDEGDLPEVVSLDELTHDSDHWRNPRLRFAPLLPFQTREAGFAYVCQAIHWRRTKVGAGLGRPSLRAS